MHKKKSFLTIILLVAVIATTLVVLSGCTVVDKVKGWFGKDEPAEVVVAVESVAGYEAEVDNEKNTISFTAGVNDKELDLSKFVYSEGVTGEVFTDKELTQKAENKVSLSGGKNVFYIQIWNTAKPDDKKTYTVTVTKEEETHTHSFGAWTVVTEATCTADGRKERVCSCGEKETESIPATGHSYGGWTTSKEATCGEVGEKQRVCSSCGHTEKASIAATGKHTYGEWHTTVEPTCVAGEQERSCTVCGHTETKTLEAVDEHTFGEWTVITEPDCYHEGSKEAVCTVCGEEVTQSIPFGHEFGEWLTVKEATCTENGQEKRICRICGEEETRDIESIGAHSFGEWTVVTEPTCTTSGKEKRVCTLCEEEETRIVAATGHSFGEWEVTTEATCGKAGEEQRVCSACGHIEKAVIPATGLHNFGEWETETEATCTEDGVKRRVCATCGLTEKLPIPATGEHSFGEWTEVTPATCTEEGQEKRTCDSCAEEEFRSIDALGHDYDEGQVTTEATCTEAGVKTFTCQRDGCGHSYTEVIEATGHNVGEWTVNSEATCGEDGERQGVCTVCSETVTEVIPATGEHTFGEWSVTVEPTCKDGEKQRECSVCHNIETEVIPATGEHAFGEWEVTKEATCTEDGEEQRVCADCGHAETEVLHALGHRFSYGRCIDCNEEEPAYTEGLRFSKGYNESFYTVDGYYGTSSSVVIPSVYNNLPVAIGSYSFGYNTNTKILSLTIPYGIYSVSSSAFDNCVKLVQVINMSEKDVTITNPDAEVIKRGEVFENTIEAVGDFTYYIAREKKYLLSYNGTETTVDLSGTGVTDIYQYAFYFSSVTEVIFPETLRTVGNYAFYGCDDLKVTAFDEGLVSIGNYAFYDCVNLKDIVLPSSVTSVGEYSFANCYRLKSVELNEGLLAIGDYAFNDCYNLTAITVPSSVTKIGENAFYGCEKLVWILNKSNVNVTSPAAIGGEVASDESAFVNEYVVDEKGLIYYTVEGKKYLLSYVGESKTLDLSETGVVAVYPYGLTYRSLDTLIFSDEITESGENAFYNSSVNNLYISDLAAWCGIGFAEEDANPLGVARTFYINGNEVTELVIPEGVTEISAYAFYGGSFDKVTIHDGVQKIGSYAFYGCDIGELHIESMESWCGIEFADGYANPLRVVSTFRLNGESVTDLVIPEGVTEISAYAFYNADNISKVTFPESLRKIGAYAFYDCNNLSELTLGASVTEIGEYAFYDVNLTEITFNDCLEKVGYSAFYRPTNTDSGTVNADSLESWLNIEFADGYANPLYRAAKFVVDREEITVLDVPYGVAAVKDYAFYEFEPLTKVILPETVVSIGRYAFAYCENLTSVTGSGVTEVGYNAFYEDGQITYAEVTTTVLGALYLDEIVTLRLVGGETLTLENEYGYYNYRPFEKLESLTVHTGLKEIAADAFKYAERLKDVFISDLSSWSGIIFGNGYANPLYHADNLLVNGVITENIVIPEGTTTISDYAFYYYDKLLSVSIPASVGSVGKNAFRGCFNLSSVTFAEAEILPETEPKATSDEDTPTQGKPSLAIGERAFAGCGLLTEVVLPTHVTSVGAYAFYNCSGLTELVLGESLASVQEFAFAGCVSLIEVTIPENVTFVSETAFLGSYKLIRITNKSACKIVSPAWVGGEVSADGVFVNKLSVDGNGIQTLTVGDKVYVFGYVGSNAKLDLSSYDGKEVYVNAFYGNENITEVVIPANMRNIGNNAFFGCVNIRKATLPDKAIAFIPKASLTQVTINGGEIIPDFAFQNCTSLKEIVLPSSIKSIGRGAFVYIDDLTIRYGGTKAQWAETVKGTDWNKWSVCTVICTDGTVKE